MTRQSIPFGLPSRIAMTPIRYVVLVVFILVRLFLLAPDPVFISLSTDWSAFYPQLLQRVIRPKDVSA